MVQWSWLIRCDQEGTIGRGYRDAWCRGGSAFRFLYSDASATGSTPRAHRIRYVWVRWSCGCSMWSRVSLCWPGGAAGQALSALWYLGRLRVSPATIQRIAERLSASEFEALCQAKAAMPAWMLAALSAYERGESADRSLNHTGFRGGLNS